MASKELSDAEIAELEDWLEYFRLYYSGLSCSPPDNNPEVIKQWEQRFKEMLAKPKIVPFTQPTGVIPTTNVVKSKRSHKSSDTMASGFNPMSYEIQQESNYTEPATL